MNIAILSRGESLYSTQSLVKAGEARNHEMEVLNPQMFTSTRQCAEPMPPLCRLKLKVTLECQMSDRSNVRQFRVRSINPSHLEAIASNDKSRMLDKNTCWQDAVILSAMP